MGTQARALGAVAFTLANLVAVAVYSLYVPADYETNPIGIFRSMGLDLITLVVPTEPVWPAAKLNYAGVHSELWGDGSNSAYNYVGFAGLVLAGVCLGSRSRRPEALALAVAGLVAFVLALGPSLKIDESRPAPGGLPTFESYLMPEGVATADLPWDGLFTAVPGINSMRATYRWYGVTRFAVVVLAGLAVTQLLPLGGRWRWIASCWQHSRSLS